jgi:hypothetical protein
MTCIHFKRSALALAAALLVPAGAAWAVGGEAEPPEVELAQRNAASAPAGEAGGLSRAEVREALRQARAEGTLGEGGERGDSDAVLAARERHNAEMSERLQAAHAAATPEAGTAAAGATQYRTELVIVLPDGRHETASVEFYALDEQGQPVPINGRGTRGTPVRFSGLVASARAADFAIVTLPPHTDAATQENLRNAWELLGLSGGHIYFEIGPASTV